jgi:RNA polymerase sigma-70 factor (ECF subfamily)
VDRDADLLERLLAGEESAFAALVDAYHTRLVRFALTFVSSWQSAEDAAQDTWVAVIRGLPRFEGRSSLQTWLFRICANRARSRGGRDHRTVAVDATEASVDPHRFGTGGGWLEPPESWSDVDERLTAQVLAPVVLTAITQLPEAQKQVVTLRDVEGLSSREVCEVLSLSEANQRVLLHRARARLRTALEAHQAAGAR